MGYKGGTGSGGGKDYPKPPAGKYVGVAAAYYMAGTHETEYAGEKKSQPKVSLVWEIECQDPNGKPFQMVERNTDSLFKSSRLKVRIESHIGRSLTEDEVENGFDLDGILGKPVMVHVNEDGYVEKVDELQDPSKAIPVRLSYSRMPGLAMHWAKKAKDGTVFPWFGYWDGEKPVYIPLHEEDVKALGSKVTSDASEDEGQTVDPNAPQDGEPF